MAPMYMVIDLQTGFQVGRPCKSRRAAQRRADRLDQQYGAVRYAVRSTIL
jgi:hypothetical protein